MLLRRRRMEQQLHRRVHSLPPEDVVVVQNPGGDAALVMAIKLSNKKPEQGVLLASGTDNEDFNVPLNTQGRSRKTASRWKCNLLGATWCCCVRPPLWRAVPAQCTHQVEMPAIAAVPHFCNTLYHTR